MYMTEFLRPITNSLTIYSTYSSPVFFSNQLCKKWFNQTLRFRCARRGKGTLRLWISKGDHLPLPPGLNSRVITGVYSSLSSHSDLFSPSLLSPTFVNSDPVTTSQGLTHNPSFGSMHRTTSSSSILKRRRLPLPASKPTPFCQKSTSTRSLSTSTSYTQIPNLAPCHICHRRPTAHSDLPGYSSCEACERRTCYICMRVCEGENCRSNNQSSGVTDNECQQSSTSGYFPSLHKPRGGEGASFGTAEKRGKSICSKCCVEVGAEGKVWCIVCFEDDADEDLGRRAESDDEVTDETGRVEEWLSSFAEGEEERCE